jgi:hypothetical protein
MAVFADRARLWHRHAADASVRAEPCPRSASGVSIGKTACGCPH